MIIIQNQDKECQELLNSLKTLQLESKEKDEALNEFEIKFEKVKIIISEKDIEISNSKTQIQ